MKKRWLTVCAFVGLGFAAAGRADDIRGQDRILCSASQATLCDDEGGCKASTPWSLNIPAFIEIDLKDKTFSTTKASGENRSSPVRSIVREGGLLILQGIEGGRAFSFVIGEAEGLASIAVARDGSIVTVFGACTPVAGGK
jgi:hypothetical protein